MSTLQRPTTRSYAKKNNLNMTTFFNTKIGTKKRKRSPVLTSSKSKKKIKKEFEMDDERLFELLSKQQKTISEKQELELLSRLETLKQPFGAEISEKELKEKYKKFLKDDNPDTQLNIIQTLKNAEMMVEIANNSEQLLNGCNDNIQLIINYIKQNRADVDEKFRETNELIKNMKLIQRQSKQDTEGIIKNQEKMMEMLQENLNNKSIEKLKTDTTQLSSLLTSGVKNITKMLILSPFKITNIIVFKPAGYFFYHVFGKWFYFIWGGLMFLLCILCLISIYINLNHYNPNILEYIIKGINMFKNIIFSLFGEPVNKLISLFDGTITIIKEYLLNGYEIGKREFFAKVNEILFGIKDYIMNFIPKLSLWDGQKVSKVNNFKYKIVVNNNSKKIKLVKLKTNSLKSIKRSLKTSLKTSSKRSLKTSSKRSSKTSSKKNDSLFKLFNIK
jgi:hypothetical protein